MRINGRRGAYLRKGWKGGSTKQNPRHTAAPDLLDRDFIATAPNRKWVADLTRIRTGEGVLWLASGVGRRNYGVRPHTFAITSDIRLPALRIC